ncbi:uncharacterized protein LOC129588800 [Paramacrobiotus metropolitanus]|uniref:uncharacterized protein LOC129588800 n=1 Tax=Paramacrobiotus metropolitanus TaxID=2943436 RepID=UPI0024458977|nr:uncharacterized protein LOC129588800 [Paramacrobiotus metropolitanus]XP_055339158.1 uncharacterized protein LOC129588800 [Paramacrobiotus metropolitanus]XP_055339159.1 uncharacterized protein LOC129588800 [Paramacrobiotus metropolitanus]XP_055339160.1 uncharacterized protein LOC129588800 [Paramacrobiotus metropolitanus]
MHPSRMSLLSVILLRWIRASVAIALAKLMRSAVSANDSSSWLKLLSAPSAILSLPGASKKSRKTSITSHIRDQIAKFESGELDDEEPKAAPGKPRRATPEDEIARRVGIQIDDFNVSGAARTLLLSDSVADSTPIVIESMKLKHPAAPLPTPPPDPPASSFAPLTPAEVLSVLEAMPRGSAGGLDYLRPQHSLDLIGARMDDAASSLCDALTDLLNLILAGKAPPEVVPLLCGARLVALRKKDGGLRPIAVGNIYRRIAAKAVDIRIRPVTAEILQPHQLGPGAKRRVEGIIHAARGFLRKPLAFLLQYSSGLKALLKIDFTNAFNCVSREEVLRITAEVIPEYYGFVKMCYGSYSSLFLGETIIASQSGVQQGDPLGPVLFCLVLQFVIDKLNAYLNAWYMDDGTLGGTPSEVIRNFLLLIVEAKKVGLEVNIAKCELFLCGGTEAQRSSAANEFTSLFPGIALVTADKLNLL